MKKRSKKIIRLKSILDAPLDYLHLRHDRERAIYLAAYWLGVADGINIAMRSVRQFAELRKMPGHPFPGYWWLALVLGLGEDGSDFLRWLDKRMLN
jgi:hypothetical protein